MCQIIIYNVKYKVDNPFGVDSLPRLNLPGHPNLTSICGVPYRFAYLSDSQIIL